MEKEAPDNKKAKKSVDNSKLDELERKIVRLDTLLTEQEQENKKLRLMSSYLLLVSRIMDKRIESNTMQPFHFEKILKDHKWDVLNSWKEVVRQLNQVCQSNKVPFNLAEHDATYWI